MGFLCEGEEEKKDPAQSCTFIDNTNIRNQKFENSFFVERAAASSKDIGAKVLCCFLDEESKSVG